MSTKKVPSLVFNSGDYVVYPTHGVGKVADVSKQTIAGSELEFLKQRMNKMANDITETLGAMNSLVYDNSEYITKTLANLSEMSGTINSIIKTEEKDLRDIIDNMNALSANLRNNSGKIDNIVTNVEGFTDSLKASNIPTLVNNLSTTLDEMNTMLAKVNNSEGTIGKMVGDEALYDSLVSASSNLSLLLGDLKQNPKRYVHFSLFGRKKDK